MQLNDVDTKDTYNLSKEEIKQLLDSKYESAFKEIIKTNEEPSIEIKYVAHVKHLLRAHKLGWIPVLVTIDKKEAPVVREAFDYYCISTPKRRVFPEERFENPVQSVAEMLREKKLPEIAEFVEGRYHHIFVFGECLIQAMLGVYWPCPVEIATVEHNDGITKFLKEQKSKKIKYKDGSAELRVINNQKVISLRSDK